MNNPYAPSDLPADGNGTKKRASVGGNPHVDQMFFTQKLVLGFCVWYAVLYVAPPLPPPIYHLTAALGMSSLVVFWFYVFLSATWNHNLWVGLGHAFISACLTPFLLVGVVLIPILIRGDAERLEDTELGGPAH